MPGEQQRAGLRDLSALLESQDQALVQKQMRADISLHLDSAARRALPYHTPPQSVKPRTGSVMSQFYSR